MIKETKSYLDKKYYIISLYIYILYIYILEEIAHYVCIYF